MNRWHSLPAEVYALVERTPAAVLLECGKRVAEAGEAWTQLFLAPVRTLEANTAAELAGLFTEIESAVQAGFAAVGFFTYECGACFEPTAAMHPPRPGQPLAWFGIYERGYRFDHATGNFAEANSDFPNIPGASSLPQFDRERDGKAKIVDAHFTLTESEYAECIATIHEWIRAGDVYQLNFTAPFRVDAPGSAAALYAALRVRQPVEYGAFLHWQAGRHILSFSPELFFSINEERGARSITTKPMKGTAARGRTTREDRERAEWLRHDAKNRAENLMIVDLLRNDLGRLAKFGTVRAEDLFAIERYPTLWQMTSTIKADLRPEVRFCDIFRALFPCGSITGAPKVRAMELLAQLEGRPRGVYTGAIGFFSPQRTVFNVAIRTLELEGGQGTMGVGSGIVIDSDPAQEYRECLLKSEFLTQLSQSSPNLPDEPAEFSPAEFSLIETLLWDGRYPLIELHLDRLVDSADYFDFPCDRAVVNAALEAHARSFSAKAPRRIRLLLDQKGEFQIGDEAIPVTIEESRIGRVCISKQCTNPDDTFLYHKTTRRALYFEAHQEATQAGCDDVLFFNQRGELTEGAISNVFVEKNGRLLTPPVECGLLPGVYRRHLLETRPNIEERVLHLEDLRTADAVYIANAVRGLRQVEVANIPMPPSP